MYAQHRSMRPSTLAVARWRSGTRRASGASTTGASTRGPSAGALAFRVVHGDSGEPQNEHGRARVRVGNFHGAGHAIRRSALDVAGHLDESCFFGAEEVEFAMRLLSCGMTTVYTPDLEARHFNFTRAGKVKLEASGGINKASVKEIAETGVDPS
jgi:GT2 family glycosyltransferase